MEYKTLEIEVIKFDNVDVIDDSNQLPDDPA